MRIVRSVFFSLVLVAIAATASAQVTLYAATGAGQNAAGILYTVNPATGASTAVGPIGYGVTGLAFHPTTGVLYGVTTATGRNLITINPATGAGTLVGSLIGAVADITFRADGTLFGWYEPSADDLITINLTTGAGTVIGDAGLSTYGGGLAFSSSGTLYLAGSGVSGALRTVNPATGAVTTIVTLGGTVQDGAVAALAFHPTTGGLYGVDQADNGTPTSPANLIQINGGTGAVTTIGALPGGTDALVFGGAAVPTMPEGLFLVLALILVSGAVFALRQRGQRGTRLA